MDLLLNGILLGLFLSILVGPILFALVQTSLEHGARRGIAVGLGIWISDVLFIAAVYFGMSYVAAVTDWPNFEEVVGTIGGVILMGFGAGMLVSKAPKLPQLHRSAEEVMDDYIPDSLEVDIGKPPSYWALWLKGFLINTINPFTVFFWTGVSGNVVNESSALLFYGGILGTIILTDSIKVLAAKRIRQNLKPVHVLRLRQISGAALFIFGIVLMVRVYVN